MHLCTGKNRSRIRSHIEACHQKITPQLRRKTSPRSSRCSASLEAEESDPEQPWKRLRASCGLSYAAEISYLDRLTLCEGLTLGGSVPRALGPTKEQSYNVSDTFT